MLTTNSNQIEVRGVRLTLLWHQNLMAAEALARPSVTDIGAYQELFNTARKDQTGQLSLPWPDYGQQLFWERYLRRWHQLPAATAREGWRALVPLRATAPLALWAKDPDTTVWSEGFLHPWGATFLLTLNVTGRWPGLGDAAQRLIELRRERSFTLEGREGDHRLEDAATAGLEALASRADDAASGTRWDPFSICTLLAAKGSPAAFDPALEETGVARFLQAVSTFNPNWESDAVRPAAAAKVAGKSAAPASHLVYGTKRGRAIWSPTNFSKTPGGGPSTLGCHHRNLVLASMQTEALGRFAEDTANRLGAGTALSGEQKTQAGWAVRILGDLYLGSNTYKSGSVKAQIAQSQLLEPINAVRAEHGLPAIT
jgi:hypothetical protein